MDRTKWAYKRSRVYSYQVSLTLNKPNYGFSNSLDTACSDIVHISKEYLQIKLIPECSWLIPRWFWHQGLVYHNFCSSHNIDQVLCFNSKIRPPEQTIMTFSCNPKHNLIFGNTPCITLPMDWKKKVFIDFVQWPLILQKRSRQFLNMELPMCTNGTTMPGDFALARLRTSTRFLPY